MTKFGIYYGSKAQVVNRQLALPLEQPDSQPIDEPLHERLQRLLSPEFKLEHLVDKHDRPLQFRKTPCKANDKIIILRIAANKQMSFEQDFTQVSERWNPSILVICDIREGINRFAIQQKREAFGSTNQVAKMLCQCLNHYFDPSCPLKLEPYYQTNDVFEVVKKNRNRINYMHVCINEENTGAARQSLLKINADAEITSWINSHYLANEHFDAYSTHEYWARGKALELNVDDAYFRTLVQMCASSATPIIFKTTDEVEYECFVRGSEEPTPPTRIATDNLDDDVVKHLTDPSDDLASTDLFGMSPIDADMQKVVEFMNRQKNVYN